MNRRGAQIKDPKTESLLSELLHNVLEQIVQDLKSVGLEIKRVFENTDTSVDMRGKGTVASGQVRYTHPDYQGELTTVEVTFFVVTEPTSRSKHLAGVLRSTISEQHAMDDRRRPEKVGESDLTSAGLATAKRSVLLGWDEFLKDIKSHLSVGKHAMNKQAVVQELVKVAGLLVTASGYQRLIETELKKLNRSDVDPRHVEAYMRVENRTLDNLSPSQFRQEVKKSVEAVDEGGVAMAERVTKSYGL